MSDLTGRGTTAEVRHGHRCERYGGESWCLCAERQKEANRG